MKKIKIKNKGLRKKTTVALWVLLVGSLIFGIYKNFTAIDQHTIHEKKIIQTKIVDTNFVSSYVENFIQVFYSWEPTKEALEKRNEKLKNFMPDNLLQLNQEMIRSDIPTKAIVKDVKIWKVDQLSREDYSVVYSVIQNIEESKGDKKENRTVESAFSVQVKTNGDDQLVILSNPVMASAPKKLEINSEPLQDDIGVNQETKEEILDFLNTFFKVYPTAKKTELLYYTNNEEIKEINKGYLFTEIKQINYFNSKEGTKVAVIAVYLDEESKAILPFMYTLVLTKTETNWVISSGI
ncbi:conjugal transfer protein [Enterococcus sp. AZ007]|uniref:conjugal transfer protein n=1 Tax=Enterococcus sp. AZ007 TaxID=2774839 RepID=UPI003F20B96F